MKQHDHAAGGISRPAVFSAGMLAAVLLSGCSGSGGHNGIGDTAPPSGTARPATVSCPAGVPSATTCMAGRDSRGAYYLIAVPDAWNGHLVLHAHGGPSLNPPTAQRPRDDLERWSIMVRAGYAWAGSSFRQGGVEVRAAAEDTETLRRLFNEHVGTPTRTILHGQSWGGGVAAKGAELFTAVTLGAQPYDAVLLSNGLLAGGTRSYDFRLDLRVVYQYLCNNHPRPSEPDYPLNLGLPTGVSMSRANLAARVNECLGLDRPVAQRSAEQRRRIDTIENVIRIPASSIQSHLEWGTFHFQDISSKRTGGASPFGNIGVDYRGSDDDVGLNAGVRRYRADTAAFNRFAADTDPSGQIPVPVLTVHWIHDPTVFVELESTFRETMTAAGNADHLVQTFTRNGSHSYISDVTYVALMESLLAWLDTGIKPSPTSVSQRCTALQSRFGNGCSFDTGYSPPSLVSRVPARDGP
jgi:hypothetical protein